LENSGWYNGLAHKHYADFKKGREVVTGDIGYVPTGAGHYIRNTGSGILRVLLVGAEGYLSD
jgi:mannose-6-phosphate isomerase-like protein (cupin superfamily)